MCSIDIYVESAKVRIIRSVASEKRKKRKEKERKKKQKKELVVKRVKVWLQSLLFELASNEKKVAEKRTYIGHGLTVIVGFFRSS